MKKITAAEVKSITKQGIYRAEDTLYLLVKKSDSRSWIQRLSVNKKRCDIGLGPVYAVSLAEVRNIARENRVKVFNGINPLDERRKPKTPSFRQTAIDTHRDHTSTWSNRHADTWMQMLELHAFPKLGDMTAHEITQSHVLDVLKPV